MFGRNGHIQSPCVLPVNCGDIVVKKCIVFNGGVTFKFTVIKNVSR